VIEEPVVLATGECGRSGRYEPFADVAHEQRDPSGVAVPSHPDHRVVDALRKCVEQSGAPQGQNEAVPVIHRPGHPVGVVPEVLDHVSFAVDDRPLER